MPFLLSFVMFALQGFSVQYHKLVRKLNYTCYNYNTVSVKFC